MGWRRTEEKWVSIFCSFRWIWNKERQTHSLFRAIQTIQDFKILTVVNHFILKATAHILTPVHSGGEAIRVMTTPPTKSWIIFFGLFLDFHIQKGYPIYHECRVYHDLKICLNCRVHALMYENWLINKSVNVYFLYIYIVHLLMHSSEINVWRPAPCLSQQAISN